MSFALLWQGPRWAAYAEWWPQDTGVLRQCPVLKHILTV
ncbi:hypothetical protein PCH70_45000 [Pseudomonas cichorii JBC1]|nr:hypothetical protein PCH70_45000 [Pseudomonas cichorii JBC1]